MKTLGQVVIVLLAATLIAGAAYGLLSMSGLADAGGMEAGGPALVAAGSAEALTQSNAGSAEQIAQRPPQGDEGRRSEGGIAAMGDVLKNALIIALITALVMGATVAMERMRFKARRRWAASP